MAKKKEDAGNAQETRRKPAGKSQASRRKPAEQVLDINKKEMVFEMCVVFKEGDNIDMIAKQLTGHSYMAFKVCEYSGVKYQDVRPGTILKWPVR